MGKIFELWKKNSYVLLLAFVVVSLFDFRIGMIAIICMIAPIIVSIFRGRYWCGNLCPRGNFYDNVVSKFSKKKAVPRFLKSIYFRILVILFMFTMFGLGVKQNWGNPAGIGMVFYRIVVITTLVGVGLSFFYSNRTWCHFCPMGSIAAFISYLKKDNKRTLEVSNTCVNCKICAKKCPMGILPYEYKGDILSHPNCIQCAKCVIACPKKSIGYDKLEIDEEKETVLSAVFGYIGNEPKTEIFKDNLNLTPQGYIITDESMQTNIKEVHGADDVKENNLDR